MANRMILILTRVYQTALLPLWVLVGLMAPSRFGRAASQNRNNQASSIAHVRPFRLSDATRLVRETKRCHHRSLASSRAVLLVVGVFLLLLTTGEVAANSQALRQQFSINIDGTRSASFRCVDAVGSTRMCWVTARSGSRAAVSSEAPTGQGNFEPTMGRSRARTTQEYLTFTLKRSRQDRRCRSLTTTSRSRTDDARPTNRFTWPDCHRAGGRPVGRSD
jgi:hypothetical protein